MLTTLVFVAALGGPPLPQPGIQWFTQVEQGLAEAKRTGRPIFLMSAAPQCAEVPGNW